MNNFFDIHEYDIVTSTFDAVKQAARAGAKEGFVAIAREQTSGRGRMGRRFHSPGGLGLYMSALFRPNLAPYEAVRITTMAAVATCEAIEGCFELKPRIKWINDVMLNGRKVSGILTESASTGRDRLDYAILGIGVNLAPPEGGYPEEIRRKAGALFEGRVPAGARDELARAILERLDYYYKRLPRRDYLAGYKCRCDTIGREVEVITPSGAVRPARAIGLGGDCELEVVFDDGERALLTAGEVVVGYENE